MTVTAFNSHSEYFGLFFNPFHCYQAVADFW